VRDFGFLVQINDVTFGGVMVQWLAGKQRGRGLQSCTIKPVADYLIDFLAIVVFIGAA